MNKYSGYEDRPHGKELYKLWNANRSTHISNLEAEVVRLLEKASDERKSLERMADAGVLVRTLAVSMLAMFLLNGCTVISNDRVFPKLAPFWTAEAKAQRESNARQKETRKLGEALAKEWGSESKK